MMENVILLGENSVRDEEEKGTVLFQELRGHGFPEDLCREIAYRQLKTDYTANRMLGYLYAHSQLRAEDVVDEMIAILSDREMLIRKHEAEEAQAKVSELYRNGIGGEEIQ